MKSPRKSHPNPHNLLKLFVKLRQNKIVKVWGVISSFSQLCCESDLNFEKILSLQIN